MSLLSRPFNVLLSQNNSLAAPTLCTSVARLQLTEEAILQQTNNCVKIFCIKNKFFKRIRILTAKLHDDERQDKTWLLSGHPKILAGIRFKEATRLAPKCAYRDQITRARQLQGTQKTLLWYPLGPSTPDIRCVKNISKNHPTLTLRAR